MADRLALLQSQMKIQDLDGFLVPLADEHQGEYVPKHAGRLAWLTGFTGSAGLAVILKDQARLFVDGRYTLQAGEQVDSKLFDISHLVDQPPTNWIKENLKKGDQLGFDPWLHTNDGAQKYRRAAESVGASLVAATPNPLDQVWVNQPPPPLWPVSTHDISHSGASSVEKRGAIASAIGEAGEDFVVLTAPDSIAWLANIRGGDVPYTPFVLAFAILKANGELRIYTDRRKLPPSTEAQLEDGIWILDRSEFDAGLSELGKSKATVRVDPATAAESIFTRLKDAGAKITRQTDPCQLLKACKNETELSGMRAAHTRDGVALVRFLSWLAENGAAGKITEMDAARRVDEFRRDGEMIQGLSFPTISGAGANGAIVHYRVTPESNAALKTGSLYLVDSGAQYLDGTTDVTRTVAIGDPTPEMVECFTNVLKGHIALASQRFPEGTTGSQLDVLARMELWREGLDYDHGTGHGVGSFLGVHEGPQRISKVPNRVALKPGMVISNEPGYYKTGEFGIRIENLIAVRECAAGAPNGKKFLEFEVLTLAPIDLNLIEPTMLEGRELAWLNQYHARVRDTLAPLVGEDTRTWLETATRTL
ncbi:MAG: aminopeptidase P family protein [Rhodospirillales bacterium]|nr:aminopeptidase P family protein [Rhodospirillales bacterium]